MIGAMARRPVQDDQPPPEDARKRASDGEREDVAAMLARAMVAGRLTPGEYSDRAATAQAARYRDQLDGLLADLPGAVLHSSHGSDVLELEAGLGGSISRRGLWKVPPTVRVRSWVGGLLLDFSEAECDTAVVAVELATGMCSRRSSCPRAAAPTSTTCASRRARCATRRCTGATAGRCTCRCAGATRSATWSCATRCAAAGNGCAPCRTTRRGPSPAGCRAGRRSAATTDPPGPRASGWGRGAVTSRGCVPPIGGGPGGEDGVTFDPTLGVRFLIPLVVGAVVALLMTPLHAALARRRRQALLVDRVVTGRVARLVGPSVAARSATSTARPGTRSRWSAGSRPRRAASPSSRPWSPRARRPARPTGARS